MKPVRMIGNASEDVRRLNPKLFESQEQNHFADVGKMVAEKGRTRRMNKTEARFLEVLRRLHPDGLIVEQPTRFFRFRNGDSYTPDFIVIASGAITSYEVKGGYRGAGWEQGYERYHRAKEAFAGYGVAFVLATWNTRQKEWEFEK